MRSGGVAAVRFLECRCPSRAFDTEGVLSQLASGSGSTKDLKGLGAMNEDTSNDNGIGGRSERVLRQVMHSAKVGVVTERLVDAMDWADADLQNSVAPASPSSSRNLTYDVDRGIREALERVGTGELYPGTPVELFSADNIGGGGVGSGSNGGANRPRTANLPC